MNGEKMSVFIIAEAGVNHNGSLELAKQLVLEAKNAGADCIKFQTFKTENLVSKTAEKADYQIQNTGSKESQYNMLKRLELSYEDFRVLKTFCDDNKIEFLSTAFDLESIDFLNSLDINIWKVPSGEVTNLLYLKKIAKTKKPIIMSTGMCTIDEIEEAVNTLMNGGCMGLTLLHCTTDYPAPYQEVNLNVINTLRSVFQCPVGYSDHTKGIEVSIAAAALGATVIEKHFTLDKNMNGPDHKASLSPKELKVMIKSIRNVETAMGKGVKEPSDVEVKNKMAARKSIVAIKNIKKGELFTEENISIKRPGTGLSPMRWYEVLGKEAIRDFEEDELIIL